MSKILSVASALGALVMAATPLLAIGGFAHAEEPGATPVRILVGDLHLAQARDATVFERRVDKAAQTFCAQNGKVSLADISACRRAVREEAVAKLSPSQQQDLGGRSTALRLASR